MLAMLFVIPAKAGIQTWSQSLWTPAFAGVTEDGVRVLISVALYLGLLQHSGAALECVVVTSLLKATTCRRILYCG
jgi:hypothetical protein